jgi:quinol monooxygenase YgiN
MELNRRTLLAGGAGLAASSWLASGVSARGAEPEVRKAVIVLTSMVKANVGQEDVVKEAYLAMVEPSRKEPGCLCYNLHQSTTDNRQFMVYEQWASQEALDAHRKTPHRKTLGRRLKGRTEKGVVTFYELLKQAVRE